MTSSMKVGPQASPRQVPPRYRVVVLPSLDDFLQAAATLQGPGHLPFHGGAWLRAWFQTLGVSDGRKPLWLVVQRQAPQGWVNAMLLPLVQQRRRGLNEIAFADAGVVDYVAPIVAADWHGGASQSRAENLAERAGDSRDESSAADALWAELVRALSGHDLWRVDKMLPRSLEEAGGISNPLCLAWRTLPSDMSGNHFVVTGPWDSWRRSLDKHVRKEIERCWRVFERSPSARFERVTDPAQAQVLFDVLERQQSQRLGGLAHYRLDNAPYRAFYRQLMTAGLADDSVVLTALRDGDAVVSALFGVTNGTRYVALRQSIGGDAWKSCSPGRLLDEGTARHLHAQGLTNFDFGVGNYFHKTTLGMAPIALRDACVALSWRAVPAVTAWRARRWLKRSVFGLHAPVASADSQRPRTATTPANVRTSPLGKEHDGANITGQRSGRHGRPAEPSR